MKRFGKEIPKFVQKLIPEFKSGGAERYQAVAGMEMEEKALLEEAAAFLENEIGCPVEVQSADNPEYDPEKKTRFAEPLRPAIYIEEKKEE